MSHHVHVYPPRKINYFAKLDELLQTYKNIIIVGVDMVGSSQFQKIRKNLRKRAVMILGKNTMARRVIRKYIEKNPDSKLSALLTADAAGTYEYIRGNVGFIFTNEDPKTIRDIAVAERVPAVARAGVLAPVDVFVPAGPTGLDPSQTGFFQALNIATKIVRGSVEIISQVHLIKKGDKVGTSEVALLDKLNIKPFSYGLTVENVYEDGAVYKAEILDISQDDLLAKFLNGVRKIAALSVRIGLPTEASLPYFFSSAYAKLIAVSLATNIEFEGSKQYKEYLANPEKFAAAAAAAAPKAAAKDDAPAKDDKAGKKAEKEKEKSEESEGGAFGLFGDD